jgi:hypothetical protein
MMWEPVISSQVDLGVQLKTLQAFLRVTIRTIMYILKYVADSHDGSNF